MDLISENTQSTVVSRFEHEPSSREAYQSEEQLEKALIEQLQRQGYEYLPIHSEADLVANLRAQLERLNDIRFTDNEWDGFFRTKIANKNATIQDKTRVLQEDRTTQLLMIRDNRTYQNLRLLDKHHIHENHLQVINQYVPEGGRHANRYDVTILVNGLPMVHIELKRRGVELREAFNQINRYKRDSFWAGSGLYEYIQLFVISNGTNTKYYSNTTRYQAVKEATTRRYGTAQASMRSQCAYEFTSFWADFENQRITDLEDFTSTFLQKHTILNLLCRYCVFTAEDLLLVMRPYQICATEAILQRILIATNQRQLGQREAGGYIWHTTGSGKTLTSFKTAQLASELPYIDKVLFVVDRKDLDYQTMREYDRFKKGAANSNKSTTILKQQLEDESDNANIIITTIQKLSIFCKKNPHHDVYGKHVVIIFDECHRSQFGDMHDLITSRFKKYHIFGFTGTPIFPDNAVGLDTTESVFGKRLHTYTVINAIADQNVLPFRVEYIKTVDIKPEVKDEQVPDILREQALLAPERIHEIVKYTLAHFDQKTKRNQSYKLKDKRLMGFNSIFATASIPAAKMYYSEFLSQMAALQEEQRLKIALIYSYAANEGETEAGGLLREENSDSAEALDAPSRDFLDKAIQDYNDLFHTNFSTEGEAFQNYYKDVSRRMKNRELDILIVVNMFLTGFDATTLNTLWVDKNLRQHGLMQAYSRTNRILNSIKTFGNIVCFRNLEDETNAALKLFGDDEACGIVLLRTFDEYMNGFDENGKHHPGYKEIVNTLLSDFPISQPLLGEEKEKEFIKAFGSYMRAVNILSTFDRYEESRLLSDYQEQDYRSLYLDLRDKYRRQDGGEAVNINDDLVFEVELLKQVDINIDYILHLVAEARENNTDIEQFVDITLRKAVGASEKLRNKRELIEDFVLRYSGDDIQKEWTEFIRERAKEQMDEAIASENLNRDKAYVFMQHSFQIGEIEENGTAITECLPPMPIFGAANARAEKKERVLALFRSYFDRFYDILDFDFE